MYADYGSGDLNRRWARFGASMDVPDVMPLFDDLTVDRLGTLWVQRYEPPWAEGDQSWAVFSQQGKHVAEVAIPAAALPPCYRSIPTGCSAFGSGGFLEIGSDYLLVAQRDDLGVQRVRTYRLNRDGEDPAGASG